MGNKINIYPNPASNNITLNIADPDLKPAIYSIKVVNTAGVTIQEITSPEPLWQGTVGYLQPGTYILRVFNQDTQNLIGESKFVKLQ